MKYVLTYLYMTTLLTVDWIQDKKALDIHWTWSKMRMCEFADVLGMCGYSMKW